MQGLKCKECKFRCHVQCEPQVRLKIMMVMARKMKMMNVMMMMTSFDHFQNMPFRSLLLVGFPLSYWRFTGSI